MHPANSTLAREAAVKIMALDPLYQALQTASDGLQKETDTRRCDEMVARIQGIIFDVYSPFYEEKAQSK